MYTAILTCEGCDEEIEVGQVRDLERPIEGYTMVYNHGLHGAEWGRPEELAKEVWKTMKELNLHRFAGFSKGTGDTFICVFCHFALAIRRVVEERGLVEKENSRDGMAGTPGAA